MNRNLYAPSREDTRDRPFLPVTPDTEKTGTEKTSCFLREILGEIIEIIIDCILENIF